MMNFGLESRFEAAVTVVANEFIDHYMAAANGEYVKVYLYFLRHGGEALAVSEVADALNHTESDVKRALAYWERAGVLRRSGSVSGAEAGPENASESRREPLPGAEKDAAEKTGTEAPAPKPPVPPADAAERMKKLSKDEEFATLLYAAQQYLGKMFTTIECEKFAYFYDSLKMSGELLEYLAEYCAQNGHTSIRYVEKVALNWYQQGIRTKAEAREYTSRFSKDISAVMKAFGLTNRSPGTAEREIIKKWFGTYGFDQSLVTEACDRTIKATQTPSFQYADKILTGWKENGVKTLADVEELDRKRQLVKGKTKDRETPRKTTSSNRFRNFEERSYNYDEAIWDDIRKRYKKGESGDGTE